MKQCSSPTIAKTSKRLEQKPLLSIQKGLSGIRPRILVWYFLLTVLTTMVSLLVTRQMYCAQLKARAEASLVREVERFKILVNDRNPNASRLSADATALFDEFLANYAPTPHESVLTLLNDRIYRTSSVLPQALIKRHPELMQQWTQATQFEKGRFMKTDRLLYAVQPFRTQKGDRGVLVMIYNTNAGYQESNRTILLVIQVTLVVLVISSVLAWITAGRVLSPLRSVTKTAQSITESDMTQRIPLQGHDEITELTLTFNEMLDRLQVAFDSQQEFLKDASHELRTPITVIQGHLEILKYQPPEKQTQTIALVMDELERMSRLVNDLLLLAKAERPDFLNLKPEELDWLTEELYLKARSFADRDWRLESKGLSAVVVDRQRLTQAMMNLVQNAVRHTQVGDAIVLGSSVRDEFAYFWVRDTGEGIAPADQERIFERFVRATHDDLAFEGAGLGLAIVQAIAQAHGGWVEVSSRVGVGSTFTMVIPLVSTPQNVANESDSHHRRQSPYHRVLGNWATSSRLHDHSR
jgi:signal transduction histidine kinase